MRNVSEQPSPAIVDHIPIVGVLMLLMLPMLVCVCADGADAGGVLAGDQRLPTLVCLCVYVCGVCVHVYVCVCAGDQ